MSKNSYELVSTKPDSDDEESSEEETFFESTKLKTVVKKSGTDKQLLNANSSTRSRFFLVAALVTALLIVSLTAGYIAYSALANPSRQTHPGNETVPTEEAIVSTGEKNPPLSSPSNHSGPTQPPSVNGTLWHRDMSPSSSELSIVVHDINNDGTLDLVLDSMSARYMHEKYRICPGKNNSCEKDFGFSPCRIRLLALDGQNGSNVWEKWVEFTPFAANCRHDLNGDKVPDCTFSGRQGSFAVLNPVDGSFLWTIDPAATFPGYSYFYPLFIRDFDRDGVIDIIVTHGGDQVYNDNERHRSNGFIFVVSGRTGQQISERIPMPDGHETYNNPIAFNISGNIELVLFGSGGETISGSLWAITVQSLQEHVDEWAPKRAENYSPNQAYVDTACMEDEEVGSMRPVFKEGTFRHANEKKKWLSKCPVLAMEREPLWNPYKLCVYEFVPGGKTGTILPPVIIDYNEDGIKDLLVSQFNDHTIMIDGASGKTEWDHKAEDTQSYSIPSPLHYNEDNTTDFLIRFNKGKWMMYDYSYMGVLDGTSGKLVWMMNCSLGAMSSAVTVKSSEKGHDGMLFLASGCEQERHRMKRKTKERSVFQKYEENFCPQAHLGVEQATCKVRERSRRHEDVQHGDEGDGGYVQHGDEGDGGYVQQTVDMDGNPIAIAGGDEFPDDDDTSHGHPEVFRPQEIDFSLIQDAIPKDLWEITDETDTFPNPWTDTRSFVQEYCNVPYDKMINRVYYITPNIIQHQRLNIKPLYVNKPYVYKPPSSGYENRRKRHGGSTFTAVKKLKSLLNDRRKVRCAHILVPMMLATTPTVGDFNNDGKLDAVVSVTYDGFPNELYMVNPLHPPKVAVTAFTIEERLKEVYGSQISDVVDFSSYYPADKQPWGQYMGLRGNGVYEPPSSD